MRTSWNGVIDFGANIGKGLGGYQQLVKTNYARNIWHIMDRFHVLPTDPRFYNLTDEQINFILYSIIEDNNEIKGVDTDVYDETFDWEGDLELEDTTDEELHEIDKLNKNMPDEIAQRIKDNIEKARQKAKDAETGENKTQRQVEGEELVKRNLEDAKQAAKVMKDKNISYDDYIIGKSSGSINYEEDDSNVDEL